LKESKVRLSRGNIIKPGESEEEALLKGRNIRGIEGVWDSNRGRIVGKALSWFGLRGTAESDRGRGGGSLSQSGGSWEGRGGKRGRRGGDRSNARVTGSGVVSVGSIAFWGGGTGRGQRGLSGGGTSLGERRQLVHSRE